MKPQELKEKLIGVSCVMHTPFKENEDVDYDALRRHARFLVNVSKNHKRDLILYTACTLGEFFHLSVEERMKILETVVDEVNGAVPVIAGPMLPSTRETIKLAKHAEAVGADGLLVVLPYYITPCEEEMYRYFSAIANSVDIGIILYNNVDATKHHINPPLLKRIVDDNENIVGVKECMSAFNMLYEIMKFEPKVRVIGCKGEQQYAFLAPLGCKGTVSFISNWWPEYSLDVLDAGLEKDYDRMWNLVRKMDPFRAFLGKIKSKRRTTSLLGGYFTTDFSYYAVSKAAMECRGLTGGSPRSPFMSISDEDKKELKEILTKIGLPSDA